MIFTFFEILILIIFLFIIFRRRITSALSNRKLVGPARGRKTVQDFMAVAQESFVPGETLIESCNMLHEGSAVLAVLTNRNIRSFQFHKVGFLRKRYVAVISGSTAIPMHEIRGMSVIQKKIRGNSSKILDLSIVTIVGAHTLISRADSDSIAFGRACERAFQDKVHLEQTKLVGDAIGQISSLLDEGLITKDEFEHAKQGLVGQPASRGTEIVGLLRQLHSLEQSGVLTASEFRMKKWDLLSQK
jgi:hypothetical protein